jgi:hypothetical protein
VTKSLEDRLVQQRERWKEQADRLKRGPEREALLQKIQQCDVAIKDWGSSPTLRNPAVRIPTSVDFAD